MRFKSWPVTALAITLLLVSAATVTAYLTDTAIHNPPNYNSFTPPAAGSSYTDPVFGSNIQRITNALNTPNQDGGGNLQWIEPEYSTASPLNIDNSRMILLHQSYYGLYNGQGGFISTVPFEVNSSTEPRWSRKDPNILYYHRGNQLKTYNVATGAISVVHTFSEYSSIQGNGEMDISYDGDHFVLAGNSRYVFVYTISSDTKGPAFDTGGRGFDSVYIAADNSVTITWLSSGTGRYTGIELFDQNMNFLRQVAHAGGHMHMSQDVNGDPVLIWTNSNDPAPACGQNAIVKIRLSDGRQTCLLSLDWSLAVHISAADNTWAFVETYAPSNPTPGTSGWSAYTNELIQIKLDGSEVRRLAHHRSRPFDSYIYMPKLSASRDSSRLVFASNMDLQSISGAPQTYADTYMILTGTTVPLGVMGGGNPSPPVNTTPPAISGTAQQGSTLSASSGAWSNNPTSYAYQWQRCDSTGGSCAAVAGATATSYTLQSADVGSTVRVAATAGNSGGSATATSVTTAVVQAAPTALVNTALPAISGTAQQGQTLTGSTGSWSGSPTSYAYQWQRCNSTGGSCAAISGANSQTCLLQSADVGSAIRVAVTAMNSAGSAAATSAQTAVVQTSGGGGGTTPPAIALVQATSVQGTGVASVAKAFPNGNTAGNLIIAFVRMSSTSQTVTLSDSLGNAYAKAVSQTHTTDGHQIHVFYAANIRGGANTVTAAFSGTNSHPWLAVYEYQGLSTTSPLDKTASTQGSGASVNSGPTATTATANQLVFAGTGLPASWTAQLTAGSGYTVLQHNCSGATSPGANEGQTTSATSSYSGTFTLSASASWTAAVATFKAVDSTPPAPPPVISTGSLASGTAGASYSATLTATGGITPYTWSVVSGSLPAGLSLASNTGVISGTPTAAGTASFTAQVRDANSQTASQAFSITINAPPSAPPIKLVQSRAIEGTGVASVAQTFAAANTAGNLIIAFVRMSSTSQTVSVTDTAGNTYVDAVSQVQSTDGHQTHIFYARNITGGNNTVTARFSSTNNHPWLAIYEYSGVTALDRTAHAQGSSNAPSSGLTAATTSANELVFAGLGLPSSSGAGVSGGSGYQMELQNTVQYGSRAATEDRIATSTAAFSGAFILSATANWTCVVATFK